MKFCINGKKLHKQHCPIRQISLRSAGYLWTFLLGTFFAPYPVNK